MKGIVVWIRNAESEVAGYYTAKCETGEEADKLVEIFLGMSRQIQEMLGNETEGLYADWHWAEWNN